MSTRRKIALAALAIGLLALGTFYETRLVARQAGQLRLLQARHDTLARDLAQVRAKNAADTAALARLQLQISAARTADAKNADSPADIETRAWLARLATVKRLFAEHPETAIPELQLLDLRAWIGTIKGLPFDTEEHTRQSLAAVRDAAKRQFTNRLASALQKYVNAREGELPPDLPALTPFFNPPVDPAMLERYKMNRAGNLASLVSGTRASDPVVLEKTAVDDEFDARQGVNAGRMADGSGWGIVPGSFGGLGPAAWIDDYDDRLKRARAGFTHDHPGTTNVGLAQLAPYLDPPIEPGKLDKLIAKERGKQH